MADPQTAPTIVCVTLNPAIDRTIEVHELELGQHAKGRLLSRHPGGKAVNVAHVLEHLGRPCILTGFIGEADRHMFEASFDAEVVRVQLFGLKDPTRENITLVDPARGIETHVRDLGSEVSQEDQDRLSKKLGILAKEGVWIVLAGSLPRGLGVERFAELIGAVQDKGARVALDSSEAALAVVRRRPAWLIKPNRDELASLSGRPTGTRDEMVVAIAAVTDMAHIVLASAGADGCFAAQGGQLVRAYLDRLSGPITNTVGCGDALLAGFLAARADARPLADCARQAVAVATSAAFQIRAGQVDPEQVRHFAEEVTVEEIA